MARKLRVQVLCKQISAALNSSASISAICSPACFRQWVVGHRQDFHIRDKENLFQALRVQSGGMGHWTLLVILSHRSCEWEGWVEGGRCLKQYSAGNVSSAPWDSMGTPRSYYTRAARDGHSYFFKQTLSNSATCGSGLKKEYKQTSQAFFTFPLLTAWKNAFFVFLSLLLLNKCHTCSEN